MRARKRGKPEPKPLLSDAAIDSAAEGIRKLGERFIVRHEGHRYRPMSDAELAKFRAGKWQGPEPWAWAAQLGLWSADGKKLLVEGKRVIWLIRIGRRKVVRNDRRRK